MDKFFEKSLKPYLWITGLATFSVVFAFLFPDLTIKHQYGYDDHMLIGYKYWKTLYQHWGIMVAGVAVQLLYSIKRPHARGMDMAFSGIEKAFFAFMFINQ